MRLVTQPAAQANARRGGEMRSTVTDKEKRKQHEEVWKCRSNFPKKKTEPQSIFDMSDLAQRLEAADSVWIQQIFSNVLQLGDGVWFRD